MGIMSAKLRIKRQKAKAQTHEEIEDSPKETEQAKVFVKKTKSKKAE